MSVLPRASRLALRFIAWLMLASMANVAAADTDGQRNDALACASPFELQLVRDLDFGRIVVSKGSAGQVDIDADGAYRQLGGAYVVLPATPAELLFCGPPGAGFEIRIQGVFAEDSDAHGAIRLAPGSVHLAAHGAELRRLNTSVWEGVIGEGSRVSLRFGARLDIPPGVPARRSSARLSVSLRSR